MHTLTATARTRQALVYELREAARAIEAGQDPSIALLGGENMLAVDYTQDGSDAPLKKRVSFKRELDLVENLFWMAGGILIGGAIAAATL